MSNHTPGPWRIGGAAIFGPKTDAPSPATIVSILGRAAGDVAAMRANARLIAAAPDMLAALQSLVWAVSGIEYVETEYAEQVAQAHAAIAKALGEG